MKKVWNIRFCRQPYVVETTKSIPEFFTLFNFLVYEEINLATENQIKWNLNWSNKQHIIFTND